MNIFQSSIFVNPLKESGVKHTCSFIHADMWKNNSVCLLLIPAFLFISCMDRRYAVNNCHVLKKVGRLLIVLFVDLYSLFIVYFSS
jgi:hypothetical protein